MTMNALVLEGSDDSLDHAVLLLGVRSDELLQQPKILDHGGVTAAGEGPSVIRSKQELLLNASEMPVAGDQSLCPCVAVDQPASLSFSRPHSTLHMFVDQCLYVADATDVSA